MIDRLLNNWKPKLASLLVAIAVWYLFKENIRRQDQSPIVSDPGVLSASVSTATRSSGSAGPLGILEAATALSSLNSPSPVATIPADRSVPELVRLRWIELGAFSTSIAEYPALRCG